MPVPLAPTYNGHFRSSIKDHLKNKQTNTKQNTLPAFCGLTIQYLELLSFAFRCSCGPHIHNGAKVGRHYKCKLTEGRKESSGRWRRVSVPIWKR